MENFLELGHELVPIWLKDIVRINFFQSVQNNLQQSYRL